MNRLSDINYLFLSRICKILKFNTEITWSMDYGFQGDRTEKVLSLCSAAQATHYYTGPAAKKYLNAEHFDSRGIELVYLNYNHYPEYPQLYEGFVHEFSILDLIFNVGPKSCDFIQSAPEIEKRKLADVA